MRNSEPQGIHPAPTAQIPYDDKREAADNEGDECDVRQQNCIGEETVWQLITLTM